MVNANLLKGKIAACGYTQGELARLIPMSKNTFSSKINGKKSFTLDEVLKMCELLNIEAAEEKCNIFLI